MPSKSPAQRLTDILENIDAMAEFTTDMTFAAYLHDRKTIYAVTRALEIISEASRRLPDALKHRHPTSEHNMTLNRAKDTLHTATQAAARAALTVLLATCLGMLQPGTALAWLYPEHRDMTVLAVQRLDPATRASLDQLWSAARVGHETRLCAQLVDTAPGNPACIDYAAWPAIAGDHACSTRDQLRTVLDTPWMLDVVRISARLKRHLATAC